MKKYEITAKRMFGIWVFTVIVFITTVFVAGTDYMGSMSFIMLNQAATYIESSEETLEVSEGVAYDCSNATAKVNCYISRVSMETPYKQTWLGFPLKRGQSPAETLLRMRGNCVDRSILQATLFKELKFDHVYLVAQEGHMCSAVGHSSGIDFIGCFPDMPIQSILRVYSDGFD